MRPFLLNLAIVLVSLAGTVLAFEAGLRVYYFGNLFPFLGGPKLYAPDPRIGFRLAPNLKSSQQRPAFIVEVSTNSHGLRGLEVTEKSDRFRIALLGDSHVFGSGLADHETLPHVLQLELSARTNVREVEVVNLGNPAHNNVQELLILEQMIETIKPDLVVLGFTGENDIHFNTAELRALMTQDPRRPVAQIGAQGEIEIDFNGAERYYRKNKWRLKAPSQDRAWYENTAIYLRGRIIWKTMRDARNHDPNIALGWPYLSGYSEQYSTTGKTAADYQAIWARGWDVTKALILKMRQTAADHGASFAMTSMPSKEQVQTSHVEHILRTFPGLQLDLQSINRELQAFGDSQGIPVIDLLGPLLAARDSGADGLHYSLFDSHMTAKAHRILARALADELVAKALIPSR